MIVRTMDKRLAVLRVLRRDADEEIYVCRDLNEPEGELSTLARFRNPALNRYLLPMLARQQENPAFEDFLGLFSQDGDLYARFRYSEAPFLSQRLEEGDFSLEERLVIGGNLLERMTLLNMPAPIQFEALRERNVTVDDSLQVRFNYVLESMTACYNVDMGFVCVRVGELLRVLFDPELSAQGVPELERYLQDLDLAKYDSYLELYRAYNDVRAALRGRAPEGKVEPNTRLFRLWRRVKELRRFVKPVLGGLVLVAAFCYLVYTLLVPATPTEAPVRFDAIGTVQIQSAQTPGT